MSWRSVPRRRGCSRPRVSGCSASICPRALDVRSLVEELDRGDVKLAVIEKYFDLPPGDKEALLPALERHIDRGGRLLLAYTEIDEWPELQELVDVRTTGDVTSVRERRIWPVDPPHPIWAHSAGVPIIGDEKFWADNGDFLDPGPSGSVLATWDVVGGPPAMTLTRAGQVLTNGFDFDAFDGFVNSIVVQQLLWMLSCQADIDGDGELTFFDFVAFQNLFVAGDPAADFAFDGRLDFFDFLAFQDQFVIGCP